MSRVKPTAIISIVIVVVFFMFVVHTSSSYRKDMELNNEVVVLIAVEAVYPESYEMDSSLFNFFNGIFSPITVCNNVMDIFSSLSDWCEYSMMSDYINQLENIAVRNSESASSEFITEYVKFARAKYLNNDEVTAITSKDSLEKISGSLATRSYFYFGFMVVLVLCVIGVAIKLFKSRA